MQKKKEVSANTEGAQVFKATGSKYDNLYCKETGINRAMCPHCSPQDLDRKVIVVRGSEICMHEDLKPVGRSQNVRKANPNKYDFFKKGNKNFESISFSHYRGNDFLNIFISGGVHSVRFVLRIEDLKLLIPQLIGSLKLLRRERKKNYRYDRRRRVYVKKE